MRAPFSVSRSHLRSRHRVARAPASRAHSRGVAIISALLVVALTAILVSGMLWPSRCRSTASRTSAC